MTDQTFFFLLIFRFVLGLAIGSFLNVVIDRVPEGKGLGGRSKCDGCGRVLWPLELIPVVSYMVLRGKSRCCQVKLGIQYPFVELLVGLIFALAPILYWPVAVVSIAIVIIDWRHHIIPDSLQVALFLSVLFFTLIAGTLSVYSVLSAVAIAIPLYLLNIVTKGKGLGYGDVKLGLNIGFWLGMWQGIIALYIAFLVGAVYGLTLLALKRGGRKTHIAFGPFLLLGAWIAIATNVPQTVAALLGL